MGRAEAATAVVDEVETVEEVLEEEAMVAVMAADEVATVGWRWRWR